MPFLAFGKCLLFLELACIDAQFQAYAVCTSIYTHVRTHARIETILMYSDEKGT
jgi:hypothetical protein